MSLSQIKNTLISEIKLSEVQTDIFLTIVTKGKMTVEQISTVTGLSPTEVDRECKKLIEVGGLIEIEGKMETMHPRFTAVNMYRKMCLKNQIEFKKNSIVDNIGIALENAYESARTKN